MSATRVNDACVKLETNLRHQPNVTMAYGVWMDKDRVEMKAGWGLFRDHVVGVWVGVMGLFLVPPEHSSRTQLEREVGG